MAKRSAEREQFLADLLTGAIEHAGYGFPAAKVWHCPDGAPGQWYAEITDRYLEPGDEGYGETQRVDLDTMAKGLGVIRDAVLKEVRHDGPVPHNAKTGERLYFGGEARRDLLLADRTNGDDGDYDVIGALAVLECALFGRVVYA